MAADGNKKSKGLALITGTSSGIGRACALKFAEEGFDVVGVDIKPSTIACERYTHFVADVRDASSLPDLAPVNYLVNNAGVQLGDDIAVNLSGTINVTRAYAFQPAIRAIVNIASASAHTGAEFDEYCASKGGVLTYTRYVAQQVAKYGATCNSISPGGVITSLNKPVLDDKDKWDEIMALTPLKKWATPEEIAEWVFFVAVTNKSMTAQDILVDNGESSNFRFVW